VKVKVLNGDCLEQLRALADQSMHCCITSPPYFGLRDYGHDGQIGLEPTPEEYVAKIVEVFREVRRVLRDDGTLWLNLGDSYAASGRGGGGGSFQNDDVGRKVTVDNQRRAPVAGFKPKDLLGIPWRVAFALQTDGWYLRQDIIWHKPNPMPESVTDRCTKAHEYMFLMAKSARYYYDAEAVKEQSVDPSGSAARYAYAFSGRPAGAVVCPNDKDGQRYSPRGRREFSPTRNRRSVWTITTKPYKGAHFATFPPDLVEPCVLAGCPKGGTVLDPFGGSGTTGAVAIEHGRNAVLIEINPKYVELIHKRITQTQPLLSV